MFYEKVDKGLKLFLRVTPKASANSMWGVEEVSPGQLALKVTVTAVPEDGKANKAVIQLFAKSLHVSKSSITVLQGESSRLKTLVIEGDPDELIAKIERVLLS